MRVLIISMGYPSKVEPYRSVFVQRLVNEIVDNGNECTVICPVRSKFKKLFDFSFENQITNNGNKVQVFFPVFKCIYTASRFKRDFIRKYSIHNCINSVMTCIEKNGIKFDFVYSHFLGVSADCAIEVSKQYNKPVFAAAGESSFPDFDSPDAEEIIKNLNRLNGIVSVSSVNRNILLERGILSPDRIKVFPNGVNSSVFHPYNKDICREEFGFPKNAFIVGFTGYFIDRKGPDRIVDAVKDLDVKLVFAGKGELKPKLLCNQTLFCDSVEPQNMPRLLSACDVFVLPTKKEGCCNSIIEAMACGLPIVSSDRDFNDDILDDTCSIKINPESISDIRKAIVTLYNDSSIRDRLSSGAIEKSKELSINNRAKAIVSWMTSEDL